MTPTDADRKKLELLLERLFGDDDITVIRKPDPDEPPWPDSCCTYNYLMGMSG